MPEVSVIIPSYNHAAFLRQAVNSVLQQTWQDFELIVVDDGSSDDSLRILSTITDARLSVISQENRGAHAAINRGIHASSGRILAILNSDDLYHPQHLEKAIAALQSQPQAGLVGCYLEVIDAAGQQLGLKHGYHDLNPWNLAHPEKSFRSGSDLLAALQCENFLATTSNYVFTRAAYDATGEFLPLRYTHDWDFALRLARRYEIILLPEFLVSYRIHGSNTIREGGPNTPQQTNPRLAFEICWILARHLPLFVQEERFTAQPGARQIEQLLHSIYTFECDRVLNVLLLQELYKNETQALALLDPANAQRQRILVYLETPPAAASAPLSAASRLIYPFKWLTHNLRRRLGKIPWLRSLYQKIQHKK